MGGGADGTSGRMGVATGDCDTARGTPRATGVDDPPPLATATLAELQCRRIASCLYCRRAAPQRWGRGRSGAQRWRCRDCRRSFSSTTGTTLHGLHAPAKLRLVLVDMLADQPSTCRRLAGELGLCAMTIWGWRQRINRALAQLAAGCSDDAAVARGATALVIVRESRKASREWVEHERDPRHLPAPDRHRWIDYRIRHLPPPRPMTPYLLPVRLRAARPGPGADPPSSAHRRPAVTGGALTSSPAAPPHDRRGDLAASPSPDGAALGELFHRFLRPFRGAAARHLAGYVAWFATRCSATTTAGRAAAAEGAWELLTALPPTPFPPRPRPAA